MLRRGIFQLAWHLHRLAYRLTGGRAGGSGTLELRTVGRRSGEPRMTLLDYLPDGDRFVVVASNAGAARHPAWWLNLEAHPSAEVVVAGHARRVRGRAAEGEERNALWERLVTRRPGYVAYQERTERRVPVVVLEPVA